MHCTHHQPVQPALPNVELAPPVASDGDTDDFELYECEVCGELQAVRVGQHCSHVCGGATAAAHDYVPSFVVQDCEDYRRRCSYVDSDGDEYE